MAASSSSHVVDRADAMIMHAPPLADWLVIAPIVLCIVVGAGLLCVRKTVAVHAAIAIAGLVLLVVLDAALLWHVANDGPVTMTMGRWLPPFGISFTVDLLGAVLALVSGIAALAAGLFGLVDVDDSGKRYGFFPFLFLLMAGVSGSFLTGDIFNLYVWFEVLLIASFGLLVLGSEQGQIDGATKYAFLNLVATTLFLIATAYLYAIFGTLNVADIAEKARAMDDTAPLATLGTLYLLAFGMKAAAFPVNFWLPASYHTPRIVASALFAGMLTKVGVYALVRTLVMLFPSERAELAPVIAVVAVLTMAVGAMGALAQSDIRRLLGYVVISGIGIMLVGVAVAGEGGIAGTVFYMAHSIVVMTALYVAAGMAARAVGAPLSITDLAGLYRSHPMLSALSLMLFLSVAGLPPFSGLWPKIMLVRSAIDAGSSWLGAAILVNGLLTTIAVGRVWVLAYWQPAPTPGMRREKPALAIEPGFWTEYLPLIILTGLSVVFGLFPEAMVSASQQAAVGILDPASYIHSVFPAGAVP
ncbi:Na+/H+ antiporter subunit D [Pararhizobium mangrovi]|uniref:Na+/H+ antiporter subunit D n=1 Tax=Pararhizobium mangrovi TaxID=2590452 RepID=A0A506TYW6_9HYPH|nr:Na+/H+ antiporter subunit D [Pararhizobium mangrovi]TPW26680.1 Na+/H+ antiporter subunit D [Pararhizobium mangrovi]